MTLSWGLGVYTPKSTIPVAEFDKVPSGVVGCENLAGGHAGLGDVGRLRLWIEEGVQLGESDLGQAHVDAELVWGALFDPLTDLLHEFLYQQLCVRLHGTKRASQELLV
jgi:hypothetical protein